MVLIWIALVAPIQQAIPFSLSPPYNKFFDYSQLSHLLVYVQTEWLIVPDRLNEIDVLCPIRSV